MKSFFHALVVILSFLTIAVNATEPNYVKTTIIGIGKDIDGNSTDQVSVTYSNGLGSEIQSKVNSSSLKTIDNGVIPDNSSFLTTCKFYDNIGRPAKTTKPFVSNSLNYLPGNFTDINEILKTEYELFPKDANDDPFGYSETKYYDEPSAHVFESSAPGLQNNINSGNTTMSWVFGVERIKKTITAVEGVNSAVFEFDGGFIISALLPVTVGDLGILYRYLLSNSSAFSSQTPTHLLEVTKDAGGKYTQTLKDLFGRTIATAAKKAEGPLEDLIISYSDYDILDNLLVETPPKDAKIQKLSPTIYRYNSMNQIIRKESPDAGVVYYDYNQAGLVTRKRTYFFDKTAEILADELIYRYDKFLRLVNIYSLTATEKNYEYERYYYDNVTEITSAAAEIGIPTELLSELTNTAGRLVAAVSFYRSINQVKNIVDLYSYDKDGNITKKFKIIPGLPLQTIEYSYDIHGKKLKEIIKYGSLVSEKEFVYDSFGRLTNIIHNTDGNKNIVEYNYDKYDQIWFKSYPGNLVTEFDYTINGQTKDINSSVQPIDSYSKRFEEHLEYFPDGNISNSTVLYDHFGGSPFTFTQNYTYDLLNRLKNVSSDLSTPKYASSYLYDDIGRIKSKIEGTSGQPGYNPITSYQYYSMTNQLAKAKQSSVTNDYLYDVFGNLVVDRQKNMIVEYDWRNLPVKFSFYNTIPTAITNAKTATNIDRGVFDITGYVVYRHHSVELAAFMEQEVAKVSGPKLLSAVTMYYDAGGKRVLKVETKL